MMPAKSPLVPGLAVDAGIERGHGEVMGPGSMGPHLKSSSGATRRGFSLIELLVVLAIIGLMLAVVPKFIVGSPGVQLRAAADGLAARLRQLHESAIRGQVTTGFALDPKARTYRLSTAPATHALPAIVTGVEVTTVAFHPAERIAQILFYPDGSSSGGAIRLRHAALSDGIRIDWLTGRVGLE